MQEMQEKWTEAAADTWARELYTKVDRKDAAAFAAVFADDGLLRFGNNDPIVGRKNIETGIAQFFTAMISLQHEFVRTTLHRKLLFLEALVTYTRHDRKVVTVPAMTVFTMADRGGRPVAERCNIYVDLAPLFAP
ncbi:MAG: nuclear transport factor 2 family protein [Gemmatimonadaceae bacterium]